MTSWPTSPTPHRGAFLDQIRSQFWSAFPDQTWSLPFPILGNRFISGTDPVFGPDFRTKNCPQNRGQHTSKNQDHSVPNFGLHRGGGWELPSQAGSSLETGSNTLPGGWLWEGVDQKTKVVCLKRHLCRRDYISAPDLPQLDGPFPAPILKKLAIPTPSHNCSRFKLPL